MILQIALVEFHLGQIAIVHCPNIRNTWTWTKPNTPLHINLNLILLGVCFLVGFLFMAMVGVEMAWEKAMDKYNNYRGKNNTSEEQHPASLVGTFSRYKWDRWEFSFV